MALKQVKSIDRIIINMASRFSSLDRRILILLMGLVFLLLIWISFIQAKNGEYAEEIVSALAVIDNKEDLPKKTFHYGVPRANGKEPNEE